MMGHNERPDVQWGNQFAGNEIERPLSEEDDDEDLVTFCEGVLWDKGGKAEFAQNHASGLEWWDEEPKMEETVLEETEERDGSVKPTFLQVMDKYITTNKTGEVNVSGVFTRECFEEWMSESFIPAKSSAHVEPEECFRKAMVGHITISDGRSTPFGPDVEAAVLTRLRRKEVWPCFKGYDYLGKPGRLIKIGIRGTTVVGYHERKKFGLPPANKRSKYRKRIQVRIDHDKFLIPV